MSQGPHPTIEQAKDRTTEVQRELEVASAELGLTHGALDLALEFGVLAQRPGDVALLLHFGRDVALQRAAEDLEEVAELLEQAQGGA